MRILLLTNVLPYPLDSGAKVRAYYMLRYLAARHEVTLVSFGRDSDRADALEHLKSLCKGVSVVAMKRTRLADARAFIRSVLNGQPFTVLRDARHEMDAALTDLVSRQPYDAIHADQLSMAQYALLARAVMRPQAQPLLLLDAHNAYYLIPRRMAEVARNPAVKMMLLREARLLEKYEADIYQRFQHVLTVTDEDLRAIRQLRQFAGDAPHFTMLPICIDGDLPRKARRSDARGLLFIGGLHWPPNADAVRWFASEIWPVVHAEVPAARVYIVGARAPDDIRALGDFPGIRQPEQSGDAPIVVTGYVDNPEPFISASAALIVALRSGGGMRVKIIEALQWGLPIVTTTVGGEGINLTARQDAMVADDARQFARAVIEVLNNPALSGRLSDNGRQLVQSRYDWHKVYSALDGIYH